MARRAPEPDSIYTIKELDQVRAIADPLRMRILEILCTEERTTKQVAEKLGEKPTRLYHHVDALEKAGLIRRTRTRQNRGTVEKYFRGVARTFRVDRSMLPHAEMPQMLGGLLDRVSTELGGLLDAAGADRDAAGEDGAGAGSQAAEILDEGVVSYVRIDADAKSIVRIRRRLERLLRDLQRQGGEGGESGKGGKPGRSFRLMIAYYPMDRGDD